MEIIKELEDEAESLLRSQGDIVRASATENLLTAMAQGLIILGDSKAERYVLEQSMAAGRVVTQNLGVALEFVTPHSLATAGI